MLRLKNKVILFLLFVVLGCAVQGPPSGGPIDNVPPEVVTSEPSPGAIHLPLDFRRIKIVFSERMKESSIRNNLFISPPVAFETHWKKGRILEFDLKESLKPQQTYVLSVGSGLQDLHNNKMTHSFSLAFSTGDTIDQGQISGRIYGLKPNETFYVFAYLLSDTSLFDPFSQKPNYVTISGKNGGYVLSYLRNGMYRLMAVEDRNHNLLLDGRMERFALSYRDVQLSDFLSAFSGLDMQISRLDTTAPNLIGARAIYRNFLRVRFNEPVVLDSSAKIMVADSLSGIPLKVVTIGRSNENKNWLELITAPLDSTRKYRLQCVHLADSSGNYTQDTLIAYFSGTSRRDTSRFKLIKHLPKDSTKNLRPELHVHLEFNQPVNWEKLEPRFRLQADSGRQVSGKWRILNLYSAEFVPDRYLRPSGSYISRVQLKGFKSYLGTESSDSLSRHFFTIVSAKELGEISGQVQVEPENSHPVVLNLRSVGGRKFHLQKTLGAKRIFKFEYVPEGKYKIDGFIDLNGNQKLDKGKILPFDFCEPFRFGKDTISVRKRWETGGIIIRLPGGA